MRTNCSSSAFVHEDLELLIAEKHAVMKVDGLPVINGVKHQLHQLFYNLIYNALQYSQEGIAPQITMTVNNRSNNDEAEVFHEIIIGDNGIGFDQQHAERIFTVFERLPKINDNKGTGIGLAICKKVVQNHGGRIFAESQPGAGARFHVLLPAGSDKAPVKKHSPIGENTV